MIVQYLHIKNPKKQKILKNLKILQLLTHISFKVINCLIIILQYLHCCVCVCNNSSRFQFDFKVSKPTPTRVLSLYLCSLLCWWLFFFNADLLWIYESMPASTQLHWKSPPSQVNLLFFKRQLSVQVNQSNCLFLPLMILFTLICCSHCLMVY